MSEQAGPYKVEESGDRFGGSMGYIVVGPQITNDGSDAWLTVATKECARLNAAFAAGAASTPRPAGEAVRLADRFPEINPANYNDDDVRELNNWGIEAATFLAAQPPSGTGGQAGDFGEPWGYANTHPNSIDNWYVLIDRDGRGPILDVGGRDVPGQIGESKHMAIPREVVEARAARIVACVNALAGMNPAAVQAVIDAARRCATQRLACGCGSCNGCFARAALASLSTGGDAEGGKP